jgi:hypothetical protein
MNDLISCKKYDKKDINYKKVKARFKKIYSKGIYYILNDLYYFKNYKIDQNNCFVQNLFSYGDENRDLLENIPLLTTQQFNDEYLSESSSKTFEIIENKDAYLSTIDASDYEDIHKTKILTNTVDDILGFLYESERYNLYLYLIDNDQPIEGKKILIKLYSTVIEQKNDKIESIFSTLKESLTSTIEITKLDGAIPKLMKSLGTKGSKLPVGPMGAVGAVGPKELLEAVEYVKMPSNADGNCFYNSIGMLSSPYMVMKEEYDKYIALSLKQKYDVQFEEQSRVRDDLTGFLKNIYNVIKDVVDKSSKQYKNSSILTYIMRYGGKDFKYVSKIKSPIGYKYYGSDEEIYFASLFYLQPIVTVTGISATTEFNIFFWNTYSINDMLFKDYVDKDKNVKEIDIQRVINFLDNNNNQLLYDTNATSVFLLRYPTSYFLVGGRGHWSYAVNKSLIENKDEGAVVGAPSGGNASYNVRTTKKIKNKYYKKGSSSSSSKTTKKHKKTRRSNKNKYIKDNILKNKKRIKNTIKL